jgi:hypothetical protein
MSRILVVIVTYNRHKVINSISKLFPISFTFLYFFRKFLELSLGLFIRHLLPCLFELLKKMFEVSSVKLS